MYIARTINTNHLKVNRLLKYKVQIFQFMTVFKCMFSYIIRLTTVPKHHPFFQTMQRQKKIIHLLFYLKVFVLLLNKVGKMFQEKQSSCVFSFTPPLQPPYFHKSKIECIKVSCYSENIVQLGFEGVQALHNCQLLSFISYCNQKYHLNSEKHKDR